MSPPRGRTRPVRAKPPDRPDRLNRLETVALRYLAHRERHAGQVRAHLERAGASPTQIRLLLSRFHRLGYLDDGGYARRWLAARLQRKPMGRERAEAELLGKGFEPPVVHETLDDVYHQQDERRLARALLGQSRRDGRDGTIRRQAALLRRYGFNEDTIQDLLGESS